MFMSTEQVDVQLGLQATVCAKFGLPCIIYMGAKDMERQALNVFRMRLLGAEVPRTPMDTLYRLSIATSSLYDRACLVAS